jgi:hypothetical protein
LRPSHDIAFSITAFITTILIITIGFFLHGGTHGLYMDDYTERAWAFDFAHSAWKLNLTPQFHIRPLAHILIANLANAIPKYEFSLRMIIALIHLLNVFLIGKLAYRLTGSYFVAYISGSSFLFPIFANEALLWFAASIANTVSLFLLLIGFHCFLSCRSRTQDMRLFCCGVGAWIIMVLFYESGLFTLLLLPVVLATAHRNNIWRLAGVWIPALAACYIPIGAYVAVVERTDPDVASRGGVTLNLDFILLYRIPDVGRRLWWLLTDWGIHGPLHEAFKLGWREWIALRYAPALLTVSLLGLCLIALLFPVRRETTPASLRLLQLAAIGCIWVALGLLPIALIKSQIVEIRTLYIPSVGFAFGLAAVSGLAVRLFYRWREFAVRTALSLAAVWVFLSSVTMAGLVRTYQLRWNLDQKQVAALEPVISKISTSQSIWLLPVGLDERSVSAYWGRNAALDMYLYGVFETAWSSVDAIRLKDGDRNIHDVTSNRWVPLRIGSLLLSDSGEISTIAIHGQKIPVQQLVPFTYEQGLVTLLNPLEIVSSGDTDTAVDLPIVRQLSATGLPVRPARLEFDPQ